MFELWFELYRVSIELKLEINSNFQKFEFHELKKLDSTFSELDSNNKKLDSNFKVRNQGLGKLL